MLFLSGGTTLKGFGKAGGIPSGSWASGGSMNTARANHTGAGAITVPLSLMVEVAPVI